MHFVQHVTSDCGVPPPRISLELKGTLLNGTKLRLF